MVSWLIDTKRPRSRAGVTSAMYTGDTFEAMPMPSPPTMRATTNQPKRSATPVPTAETVKSSAASNNMRLRP